MGLYNDTGMAVGWCVGRVPPHDLSATLIVKGTFDLRPKGRALLSAEQTLLTGDRYEEDDPRRPLLYPSDFAWFKPRTDLLLVGHCCAPRGRRVDRSLVRFRLGEWQKILLVLGNRTWVPGVMGLSLSDPEPLDRVPFSWGASFGGSGHPENPVGTGLVEDPPPDEAALPPLPNFEIPDQPITNPQSRPKPVGYAPLAPTAPVRMSKIGQYDDLIWLKQHWPWFPDDFEWGYFNAAPKDQQIPGYLKGNESGLLENVLADHPTCPFRLPGLRPRWFLNGEIEGKAAFREVPLHLDTLLVDADRCRIVLLWRGVAEIRTTAMCEILDHFVTAENLESVPASAEHYSLLLEGRKAAARYRPLELEPLRPIDAERTERGWRDEFEAPFARAEEEFQAAQERIERIRKKVEADLRAVDAPVPSFEPPVQAVDWGEIVAPLAAAREEFLRTAGEAEWPDPSAIRETAQGVESAFDRARNSEVRSTVRANAPWDRSRCEAHARESGDFSGQDLSGLDLSGLNLPNAVFRGAILCRVNFARCVLVKADFTGAVLSRSDLGDTNLREANFTHADLMDVNLARAEMTRSKLDGADLSGASLRQARLNRCSAVRAVFHRADLFTVEAREANLTQADLSGSLLEKADLSGADLTNASVEGARGAEVILKGAVLPYLHAGRGADFSKGDLASVRGEATTWEDAVLEGADLSNAVLPRANFNGARLKNATLRGADLRRARFIRADLEGADLLKVNLFRGSLEAAVLARANLGGSNLYEAEFWRAKLEGADLKGANRKGTKLA